MIAVRPLSSPPSKIATHRALFAALAVLAATLPHPVEGAPPALPSAAEITELVRTALPPGATVIQQTSTTGLPPGWQSPQPGAVTLQVSDGNARHVLSFVPLNWIGTQDRGAAPASVRFGTTAKVIVAAGLTEIPSWLNAIAPHSASLAAPTGTTRFHVGEYPQAEAIVHTLLRKSRVPRDQVAASIIALGVPAEELIRETALDSRSPARLAAIRSLRHFPGKATREALHKVIADRSRDAAASRCRIAALETCEDLLLDEHGPAVLAGLQIEKDEGVAARLADSINRLRYTPATAELRRWLKSAQSLEAKVPFARALATLRDTAARGEIQAVLNAPAPRRAAVGTSQDGPARRQLEVELQRLAGTWGPTQNGVRLSVTMESPDRVLIFVENMGPGPFRFVPIGTEAGRTWPIGLEITVDDRAISPPGPGDVDLGNLAHIAHKIAPNSAACFEFTPAAPLSIVGDHTLSATWFGLTASPVTLRGGTAVAGQASPAS